MKVQIRNHIFETNSSSTHAICISKDHKYPTELPKRIVFYNDSFGWEVHKYNSQKSRASYLYEAIKCTCQDRTEALLKIKDVLRHYGVDCEFETDSDEYGGIDHGYDLYDFVSDLLNNEEKLMTYLFGDSFVVTGNDNGYGFSDIMYDRLEDEKTSYGVFPRYSESYKSKFDKYDVYEKGN